MTLVDTSAWIEYLRATGSEQHHAIRAMIRQDALVYTTDVVIMEVLAGGRDEPHTRRLRRLMLRCRFAPTAGLDDFEGAADLYRRCRRVGETPPALNNCLVAAVAIRVGLPVMHADRDFEVIARHTELRLAQP
jgi:predicted nucleic acid-binding protein